MVLSTISAPEGALSFAGFIFPFFLCIEDLECGFQSEIENSPSLNLRHLRGSAAKWGFSGGAQDRCSRSTLPGAGCSYRDAEPATPLPRNRIAVDHVPQGHARAHRNSAAGCGRRHLWQWQSGGNRPADEQEAFRKGVRTRCCRILSTQCHWAKCPRPEPCSSRRSPHPAAAGEEMASRSRCSSASGKNTGTP